MKVKEEQELNTISDYIKQAVWNGEKKNSKAFIVDLNDIKNTMEITANIEEISHEEFAPKSYFYIGKDVIDKEKAVEKYKKMKNPYVLNYIEYNNLIKLPEESKNIFLSNLLEIETKLSKSKDNEIKVDDVRVQLFKKETEKKKLFEEKSSIEKEYIKISEQKEKNSRQINEYLEKIKEKNKIFKPINLLNKLLKNREIEELIDTYKAKAGVLEKDNIRNTEIAIEKLFYKNEVNKKIKNIEEEIRILRDEYEKKDKKEEKEMDLLKEKNMLFKIFEINKEDEIVLEKETEELQTEE